MNIWEFLGLPASHRPASKTTMLVKHRREVSKKNIKFPYAAQVKVDGVHCLVVVHKGKVACFTRTANKMTNVSRVTEEMYGVSDGVYMGELTSSAPHTLEELSGVINPNRVDKLDWYQDKIANGLYVNWFDWVPIGSLISGETKGNWLARHEQLKLRLADTEVACNILTYTLIHDEEALLAFAEACILNDEEGAVFRELSSGWEAGHKNWKIVKVVRDIDYDLMCIGYEEGEGKYKGKVANLLLRWKDGETIKAMLGKGWTHNDAECMFSLLSWGSPHAKSHRLYPIGKVYRVTALSDSSKGKLRLPKVAEHRHDKLEGDY